MDFSQANSAEICGKSLNRKTRSHTDRARSLSIYGHRKRRKQFCAQCGRFTEGIGVLDQHSSWFKAQRRFVRLWGRRTCGAAFTLTRPLRRYSLYP